MSVLTENEIYEQLLDLILSSVREKGLDTSEGSVGYDLLAPAALAMTSIYLRIEEAAAECFADTASLPYLKRRAAERGVEFRAALAPQVEISLVSGSLDLTGSRSELRFSLGELTFYAAEQSGENRYLLICETACVLGAAASELPVYLGSDPEVRAGDEVRVVSPGRDDETAEELRSRYFSSVRSAAFAGNRAAYAELALGVPGVGGCKAERADIANDGCNVLLTVISDEYGVPDQSVLDAVDAAVGETLPVCHICSVRAVTAEQFSVSARIVKRAAAESAAVRAAITEKINELTVRLGQTWAADGAATLRSSEVFSAILSAEDVLDVYSVTVKRGGQTVNSSVFDGGGIPVLGTLTLTEVVE
ncbi:MAG: baseplate J/gp47 family protein [Clostridia bacterium]|nr:baseplate J/gp47 family protein [Clostridia bacterium]